MHQRAVSDESVSVEVMLNMVANCSYEQCLGLRVTTDLDFMLDKLFPKVLR